MFSFCSQSNPESELNFNTFVTKACAWFSFGIMCMALLCTSSKERRARENKLFVGFWSILCGIDEYIYVYVYIHLLFKYQKPIWCGITDLLVCQDACVCMCVCVCHRMRRKKAEWETCWCVAHHTHNGIVDSFEYILFYFLLVIRIVTISKTVISKANPNLECVCWLKNEAQKKKNLIPVANDNHWSFLSPSLILFLSLPLFLSIILFQMKTWKIIMGVWAFESSSLVSRLPKIRFAHSFLENSPSYLPYIRLRVHRCELSYFFYARFEEEQDCFFLFEPKKSAPSKSIYFSIRNCFCMPFLFLLFLFILYRYFVVAIDDIRIHM